MRLTHRVAIALVAIVVFCGFLAPRAHAQQPPSPASQTPSPTAGAPASANPLFAKALKLEQDGKIKDTLNEYASIARSHSKEPEVAAEALYQGGLFAWKRYGKTADEKHEGEVQAVQMWKELYLDYPGTAAYQKLTAPLPGYPNGQLGQLEAVVDKHNSSDWKYQILNALVTVTGRNPAYSYWLALVLLALLVKVLLIPLTRKQYASMREMQRMQPLIKELQKKYKGSELSQKTMELYKEHGVNPLAGCLPTLIQLPFLFLVYAGIREYEFAFLKGKFLWIGSSLAHNDWKFLGHNLIGRNLADPDVPLLAIYALTNYVTMKMTPAQDPQQQQQQNLMAVMMSGFFFFMFLNYRWSSAFVLYWLALNVISIWQQYEYIYKPHKLRQQNGGTTGPESESKSGGNGAGTPPPDAKPIAAAPPAKPARVRPRRKKR